MSKALERLKQQRHQLNARIQLAEAKQKQAERKQDTRRKILIGSYYLSQAHQQGKYEELIQQIDPFLTRNSDRKLFNLPALTA